ncbi:MAG TPA: NADPH-dependent FMN reductase [Kiloniellales bacterium]|nr:NADPH-dependent FMN reductase [Kiloniellales bacterium]
MTKVAVIVGSLRRESINRRLAHALASLAQPKGLELVELRLDDLPLYNEDLWQSPPASVQRLKQEIKDADAVLFVTPEYNRSIPAVVKNVVDWASRPMVDSVWPGKRASIVGASPGAIGTAVAQSHLRSILTPLGIALLSRPEVYLSLKPDQLGEQGEVTDERLAKLLDRFLDAFAAWLERVKPA